MSDDTTTVVELPIAAVRPDPNNDRQDLGDLDELAASIKSRGIRQPLEVVSDGDGWRIVFGHRRHAAAKLAKLKTVPCIVVQLDDGELLEDRLIENLHRTDLNPIEEARAYQRAIDDLGYSQRKLASRVGKKQPHISKRMKLLKLPDNVLGRVGSTDADGITIEDALELAKLVDHPKRLTKALNDGAQYGNLSSWVRREVAALEKERRRAKVRKEIEDSGATFVEKAASWLGFGDDPGPTELEAVAQRRDVDVDTHDQADCHAVTINWDDKPVAACTDPSSHPEKTPEPAAAPATDLDPEAVARREAHQREREQLEAACEARTALGRELIGKADAWTFAGGDADLMRHVLKQLLSLGMFTGDMAPSRVFDLLDVDEDDRPRDTDVSWTEYDLLAWIGDDDERLAKASVATAFGWGDPLIDPAQEATDEYGRSQHRHLDWLATHGHEASDLERGIRPDEDGEAA